MFTQISNSRITIKTKDLNIRIIILIIMFLKFINRKEELGFLRKRYKQSNYELIVIYGRRRVGKTELIKHFIQDHPSLYFLCDKGGTAKNISRFKERIAQLLDEPVIQSEDLEEIFSYLAKKKRIIFVFDEFSYLVDRDKSIPSVFQRVVDEVCRKHNLFVILCGSSMSMMEKGVLSYKSPLYGRKTAHIKLQPISLAYFVGRYSGWRSWAMISGLIRNNFLYSSTVFIKCSSVSMFSMSPICWLIKAKLSRVRQKVFFSSAPQPSI